MSYGLQIFNSAGQLSFDSTLAVGGVCLGFYTIANGGSTFTFPDFVNRTGVALNIVGSQAFVYSIDNNLGYLRFVFSSVSSGSTVVLFAV